MLAGIVFPEIDPIAIHITEGFGIRWYALAYLVGILLGWVYALRLSEKYKDMRPDKDDIDTIITWLVLGIIIGGRLGYVFFYNFAEYMEKPLEILFVWQGGMSFHGGLLGVVAAIVIYARLNKFPVFALGDIISTVTPIGLFFGRIANFVNGELFGKVTTEVPWAVVFPYGGDVPRHPSQLYEALLEGVLLFVILFFMSRSDKIRNKFGVLTGTFIAGYGICRFIVEFFREPDFHIGYIMDMVTMGQILSLPMVLIGGLIIVWAYRNNNKLNA